MEVVNFNFGSSFFKKNTDVHNWHFVAVKIIWIIIFHKLLSLFILLDFLSPIEYVENNHV